jgi:RHS repeat-associated protein
MKDKKTRLGINQKIVDTFHKFMLIVMLHSSFVAPSQSLISDYFNNSKQIAYIGSSNIQDDRNQTSTAGKINNNGFLNNKNKATVKNANENFRNSASSNFKIESDIQSGVIGVSNNNPLDDATDNLFKFTIENLPHSSAKVFLKYDLYGVQDLNAVSRRINERPATGGYLVKIQNAWTSQKEELNSNWLQQGENKVVFSIPKNANFQYQVKNVRLEFDVETNFNSELVLHTVALNYSKDNKLYIKGFIRNPTSTTKVLAEQTALNILNGEFEGFINLTKEIKERKFVFINAYDEKGVVGQQIVHLDNIIEADKIFEIEKSYPTVVSNFKAKTAGTLITEGAKLIINDSAIITDKEISITKLRSVDIAPLGSGMVNVTKGGSAFRFLPDGTTFKKSIQIALEYDENLLPKGHSANEIKTFYFNTNTKKWIAIERDTIDKENKSILSSTTHFTDYINGIIQTPESPETAGFTPTMMSDIKAVDPSSEMTLISPPEVSQKGDANVSYLIKIPSGRNGLQPQLAIQYNSDGGNGWLGEGWGLSTPSITIDTKWGTPTFNPTKESEIYTMSGEQLMYPKHNGKDWMPNRHFDVDGATPGTFSTADIDRTPNLTFTPRKQGSFTKIERLGNSTSNYYWKATSTNGTVYWYGGKNNVNPNAVIKNDNGSIVHWGLFLIEDIHGNTIKYEYENFLLSGQTGQNANLNSGRIFRLKTIKYNGYNDANYKYEVIFNSATSIRQDASINARLGVKQIEAHFLNTIEVKKVGTTEIIRKYVPRIGYGTFSKGQLKSIAELDKNGNLFYEHKFDYYDDVSLNNEKKNIILFQEPQKITLPNPISPNFTLGVNQLFGASKINTNQTFDYGWELNPSIGLQIRWKDISQDPYKTINFGLPFGKSFSKSNGILTMVDIDGNGLDDIVYRTDNGLRFFPHYFDVTTNQSSFGSEQKIVGIKSFSKSNSTIQNKFLESWNLKLQLPFSNKRFHVGKRRFVSKNFTDIYFTDGNGDGLIDIVKDNQVVFNKGLNNNNEIEFVSSSQPTPNMLITANTDTLPSVNSNDDITEEGTFDVVRVWVAPKTGTIEIIDFINLEPDPTFTLDSNSKGLYSIETTNSSINNSLPFRLYLNELTNLNPSANVHISNYSGNNPSLGSNNSSTLIVEKGQRIYFRLKSNQAGSNFKIHSTPKINYLNEQNTWVLKDENLVDHITSEYQNAFILNGSQPYDVLENGSLTINWDTVYLNNISDSVKFEIIKTTSTPTIDGPDIEQIIFSKSFNSGITSTLTPNNFDLGQNVSIPISINLGNSQEPNSVSISFKVTSDSNLKWNEIQWKPKITFTPTTSTNGITQIIKYPVVEHSIYKSTFSKKIQPNSNWTTTNNVVDYGLKPITNLILPANNGGDFLMIVKKNATVIGKRLISVDNNGVITINNNNPIMFNSPINISQPSQQFEYTIGFYVDNSYDNELIKSYLLATNNKPVLLGYNWSMPLNSNYYLPITVESCYNELERFGSMYKEWGQFFYNENLDNSTNIPSDSNGKLLNSIHIDRVFNGNISGYSSYNCGNPSDPGYQECMENANINNVNTGQYDDPNNIPENPTDPMYNEINPVFLIANPQRNYVCKDKKCGYIEKWTGIYDSQYTTNDAFFSGSFESSSYGTLFTDTNQQEQTIQADLNTGMIATNKIVNSVSVSKTAGWSPISITKNESRYSNTSVDFLDINGDRYPDIMSSDNVKITRMTGGHNDVIQHNYGVISSNSNKGTVLTSFGYGNATGTTKIGKNGKGTSEGNPAAFLTTSPIQPSINLGSINNENSFWIDLNGDGLSDKIMDTGSGMKYHLNTGTINSNVIYEPFNLITSFESSPTPIGLSIGVPIPLNSLFDPSSIPFSISLSIGASFNGASTKATFIDINGDGLVDLLSSNAVKLNSGNGFQSSDIPFYTPSLMNKSLLNDNSTSTATISGELSRYFRVFSWFRWPKWLRIFHIKAGITASGNASLTLSNSKKSFKDFDGDGHVDLVEKIDDDVYVYYSRIRRTDKLKSVTNPLGGKFTIDYKVQPVDYDNPHAKWAMSQVIIEDGYDKVNDGVDVYKKNFVYEKGKYDRREREFYGYKTVKVEDYSTDDSGNEVIYRTSVTNYHNQSYFLNGLMENSYVIKGNDETKKYSKTINQYAIYGLNATNDEINLATTLPATYDVGGTEGRRSAAVLLKKSITELYELQASPQLTTEVSMKYDAKGRIVEYTNHGNVSDASDDYTSIIEYHNSMNALNIINVPKSIKVSTPTLGMVRERTTDVDTSNGTIVKINANNNDTWAVTKMEYDQYGNLVYIQYPENTAGESMLYKYTYDADYNKYVTKISNAFGYSSSATYDSNFDKPLEIIDLTGNKMRYKYDTFGRNTIILAPKEIQAGKPYTIQFEYYPYISLIPSGSDITASNFVPVAVTSHYDQQNPTNDIQTYTFVDGMARPIQVKKDIYFNTGSASDPNFVEALSVSGKTKFDVFARSIEQFHPYWEPLENNTKFLVNEYDSPYKSTVIYDELDRPIKNIDPEGNESTMEYTIDTDVDGAIAMKTKTDVDQNGAQHIISETFKDVSGRLISTNSIGGATGNIWTKFKYNEIGELVEYIDNEGIATTYKYDMFGRKIQVNHPDNGKTTYKYDNVNLVALQTANLESQGTTINYEYEINRLVHIKFPDLPSGASNFANVTYKYGSSGNQTGRLIYQEDATGAQEMSYGNMGELITNVRTVVGPNIPTRQFKTSFQYDSWNRLQAMRYPDGEKITYKYDLGGSLTQMTGELNGSPYDYIKRIDYDYFEQRTYLLYGNKTETFYNYTPSLRRLNNLNVKTSDGNDLFNNNYEFDKVGNVTSLLNTAGITANDMAGNYSHNFKYDEFNRLAFAEGNFEGSTNQLDTGNDANSKYALKMQYNTTHGIVTKTQEHAKNGSPFIPNTYDNVYKYITDTHKVEAIVNNATGEAETFKYDANGNITVRNDNNTHRELFWDESNRLRVVSDNHSMQHYIYDGSGERVLKANSDMEAVYENGELVNTPGTVSINGYTSYPSAFIVITADGVYSKHYYAGTQRIVSRLGDNDASIFENGCINCKQEATENSFEDSKLKQAQIQDLNVFAEKAKKGKVTLKEYKPFSIEEQENMLDEENDKELERAPSVTPIYYYHPDHLGTSTALTDFNGNAYQFFLNLPFGETMAQQLGSNYYNSPFKFNGKELDEETGFYYYGARYYDPKISLWLSVDPLAEKRMGLSPYNFVQNNPLNRIDPDGALDYPIYGVDGTYLGDDGRTGGDLAFTGELDGKGGFINLSQFTDNHTQFQIISSIVKHEGVTNDSKEYLWIAHTANNASKGSGKSLYSKLMSGYSSVPKSEKTPLSISDNSSTARFARAGVIDVMSECSSGDPTGGATLWDGTDFLAWGLNSPNGTPHNKFEEYKSISISGDIYNSFLENTLNKYSSGKVRYSGKYYNIPSGVFTDTSNWSDGNFFYNTGEKRTYGLESTGTAGRSIFWKTTK